MEIIQFKFQNTPTNSEQIVLCLGFFDALHLGHQKLIQVAKEKGLKTAVLSFDVPPAFILNKTQNEQALTSNSDKAELFESLGVDYYYIMHFDSEVASLTRYEFIEKVLKVLNPKIIVCGEDYRFGYQGLGNPTYLSQYFEVEVLPLLTLDETSKISSRHITELIMLGEVNKASTYLGRYYRISGLVMHGLGNGAKFGFPTANIAPDYPYVMPKEGVYIGYGIHKGKKYKAIITIGTHPTISPLHVPILEIHMIDFSEEIYGQYIFIEFVKYIRDNRRFDDTNELIAQLKKDKEKAKRDLE